MASKFRILYYFNFFNSKLEKSSLCRNFFKEDHFEPINDLHVFTSLLILISVVGCAFLQKVVFHDSAERITSFLRPHWSLALNGRANVVQSLPDMLEVLPSGASKGAGVQILLDHLDVPIDEVISTTFMFSHLNFIF